MRSFIILPVTVACALAGPLQPGRSYRSENEKGNYAFGYSSEEGAFHEERGSAGMKVGNYGVKEADGTQRVVNYIADEHGFRASVGVKDQEAAPSLDILVAQAHPASSPVTTTAEAAKSEEKTEEADEAVGRFDDTSPEQTPQIADKTPEAPAKAPAVPRSVQLIDGVFVQPSQTLQQLEGSGSTPQDFPATVFFVPVPQQVAYSRVQSYSVHGFTPVPVFPVQQVRQSSFYRTGVQHGPRAQISQVPVSWQYLTRSISPVASQLRPFRQIQSYFPVINM